MTHWVLGDNHRQGLERQVGRSSRAHRDLFMAPPLMSPRRNFRVGGRFLHEGQGDYDVSHQGGEGYDFSKGTAKAKLVTQTTPTVLRRLRVHSEGLGVQGGQRSSLRCFEVRCRRDEGDTITGKP